VVCSAFGMVIAIRSGLCRHACSGVQGLTLMWWKTRSVIFTAFHYRDEFAIYQKKKKKEGTTGATRTTSAIFTILEVMVSSSNTTTTNFQLSSRPSDTLHVVFSQSFFGS
jgi:hypothetical protein